jgi:PAS domain S-box-containing protein
VNSPLHKFKKREQPAEALRESEEWFGLLVEAIRDYAIVMLDPEGRIVTWNAGAEVIKGYRAEEILGQHFSCFYPPEAVASGWPDHELATARVSGRFEDEGWRIRKDGTVFWANVIITALYDQAGELRGFCKVTRDLTERKRQEEALRQSEERFRLMVEEVRDYAIFMLDPEGRVASWNAGAQRIKQYAADEIIGRHFSTFYPPDAIARDWPQTELEVAAREGRFEDEGWRLRKDGTRFWANVIITALRGPDGELRGYA